MIAKDGKTGAQIVISDGAGKEWVPGGMEKILDAGFRGMAVEEQEAKYVQRPWEAAAARDLSRYIQKMTGAAVPIVTGAPSGEGPVFYVGEAALRAEPALREALHKVAKQNPIFGADAIVVRREGSRIYLAGSNDRSAYYAVSWLLQQWGCRWYLPTDFGECVPQVSELSVDRLDHAYAPPFEVRAYWLAWNGGNAGRNLFQKRNFMSDYRVPSSHALKRYVGELIPKDKTAFDVPVADPRTIEHVAAKVESAFAAGESFSLGMDDGVYHSVSPVDGELRAGLRDKYFFAPVQSDAFLTLYNGVCRRLLQRHPHSASRIGFLAYNNATLPPQRVSTAEAPLVCYMAAIDIDPIHPIGHIDSPPRAEYGAMLRRWSEVMEGRLVVYDYDQSMLVWRDLPAPTHQAFARDVRYFRDLGLLGVDTESRGAAATTFLNLYLRGQLLWNPDADVASLLREFYGKFYGPAEAPMGEYWDAIYRAWEQTIVTEHEYFVAPAIYTPGLMAKLGRAIDHAEKAVESLGSGGKGEPYRARVRFTRLGYEVLRAYMTMVRAAASEADYAAAVVWGERGLAAREKLAAMNPTFTTIAGEAGVAWWPGEVEQYRRLDSLTNGSTGTLVARLPLEWAFCRDPHDTGLARGWGRGSAPDLAYWREHGSRLGAAERRTWPEGKWEMLRSDLYMQAQGIRHRDYQSYTGPAWYQAEVRLDHSQTQGNVHLRFPGLFNECLLYVNGVLVAHRPQKPLWWQNDYAFEWDVKLEGKLHPGVNVITLRTLVESHFGGIFRRPFLYRAIAAKK